MGEQAFDMDIINEGIANLTRQAILQGLIEDPSPFLIKSKQIKPRKRNIKFFRDLLADRRKAFKRGEIEIRHGNLSSYLYYDCKCKECRQAFLIYGRAK
jgi:hypothetical protein